MTIKVKIRNTSDNLNPEYSTEFSSGADLCSAEDYMLLPGEFTTIKTGIYLAIPEGYEAQIRPRSGLAARYGVTVLNTPGTIDADYRGEIMIILINHNRDAFIIKTGDRIAQIVFASVIKAEFKNVRSLPKSVRGTKGIGHTGI